MSEVFERVKNKCIGSLYLLKKECNVTTCSNIYDHDEATVLVLKYTNNETIRFRFRWQDHKSRYNVYRKLMENRVTDIEKTKIKHPEYWI